MRALFVLLLCAGACQKHGHKFVTPHFPDGEAGMRALWSDVLDSAKRDDRERVHDLFATTLLSDEQLGRLLGPSAPALAPRYHQLMGTLINRGAVELCGNIYEHKYDTVDVFADDGGAGMRAALTGTYALFSARVRRASEARGLRYDGYFYLDGEWKTFNQLGKFVGNANFK